MYGVMIPDASAGSSHVGARLMWTPHVTWSPWAAARGSGAPIAPRGALDEGLDRVGVDGCPEVVEVDQQEVGLRAGCQAAEIGPRQELASAERRRVEDVARQPDLIVGVGDLGQDRGPAQLGDDVHRGGVGADREVDAGLEVAL